jgi:four helix bundle protein
MGIVVEEADETQFWLELVCDAGLLQPASVEPLTKEVSELVAIFTASLKTAKA